MLLFIGFMGSSPTAKGQCTGIDAVWINHTISGGSFSNMDIGVNGILTITGGVAFSNCTLKLSPNAEIRIIGAGDLAITQCTLHACTNEMWQGITADALTSLRMKYSNLHDAEIGVYAKGDAAIYIEENVFDHNFRHIKLQNYTEPRAVTLRTNTFQSTLVPASLHPGFPAVFLIVPHSSNPFPLQRTTIGIECDNVDNDVVIGDETLSIYLNVFDNLEIGIYALNSQIEIRNNQFDNIHPDIVNDPLFDKKAAIKAEADGGSLPDSRILIGSGEENSTNFFNNSYNGIYISRPVMVEINLNEFFNIDNIGIICSSIFANTILIKRNDFVNAFNGISINNCGTSTASIICNSLIESDPCNAGSKYGIIDLGLTGSAKHTIEANEVTDYEINILCAALTSPLINGNEIYINSNCGVMPTILDGIKVVSCTTPAINFNYITGNSLYSNSEESTGIKMVQNVGGFVKNNEMKGLGAGFAGWGNNGLVNTFVNVMQDNIIGLVLGFSGNIGPQGSAPSHPSFNQWKTNASLDCYAHTFTDGSLSTIFWFNDLPWHNPNPIGADGTSIAIAEFQLFVIDQVFYPLPYAGNVCNEIDGVISTESDSLNLGKWAETLTIYANNEQNYMLYQAEQTWWDDWQSYQLMSLRPQLVNYSETLANYYLSLQERPLSQLFEWQTQLMQSLSSQYDNTYFENFSNSLSAITPSNKQEENLQYVSSAWLQSLQNNNEELSVETKETLMTIAQTCPFEAGPAIYMAAALTNTSFNDISLCSYNTSDKATGTKQNNSSPILLKVIDKQLYIHTLQAVTINSLEIFDALGRKVAQSTLNDMPIDLSHLPNGLYWYRIHTATNTVETGKIILQ
ncbi:MAG: T9SS type A sorting domain-containing protein [Sphingobacteriales bacterium]|jgi:hypothetical protein|nr:T9SS type A sorting domain-containing protein [Sphingobacteriales bacterium]MBK6890713.1 T9SS type A sorting domain-containing protein [Sphingobacteriales bacterium]MBK7526235.1 T9SS type A sorting domain-containing protein [Sphingobacteriales bacterium]MCC7057819.1 T9SS type A sorting domain-containing protein [Chitinophagales bacterium]MDA0198688.1 T9SS type A sorting domain-containing protein [Bacteroidota bacterium]